MRSWQRCCSSSRGLQRHHIMELAVGVPNYCDLGIRTAGLHLQVAGCWVQSVRCCDWTCALQGDKTAGVQRGKQLIPSCEVDGESDRHQPHPPPRAWAAVQAVAAACRTEPQRC